MDAKLFYRMDGTFDRIEMIGAVPGGVRMNGYFGGRLSGGPLDGATMTGVDHFRVRPDGVGVVDGHELVRLGTAQVAVRITGYALPPEGMAVPPAEVLTADGFTWPDVPFALEVFATFETGVPALADLNRVAVAHTGFVNMGTGELVVRAHRLGRVAVPAR
ncbi:DUF3237 family protein [Parafrankia elaeagni]|uniref:DUF3237 family protein n=1 Tax=Parafrankia elaeagni TaxID=222534 RepID=UPI0003614950|nr:DUF3237 family protein [Parafrankia elaeagni]